MEGDEVWAMPEGRRRVRRVEGGSEETVKVREGRLWVREKPRKDEAMG